MIMAKDNRQPILGEKGDVQEKTMLGLRKILAAIQLTYRVSSKGQLTQQGGF